MQYPIPVWAIKLLAALEEHEEVHADDKDPHTCVKGILDEVPAEVRAHVAAWHDGYKAAKNERATGGIMQAGKWYTVGESGCALPRIDTVRFGELEIKVVEDPGMPEDLLVAVGSCACGHAVGSHGERGCVDSIADGVTRCSCSTPLSRLIASMKIVPGSSTAGPMSKGTETR